MFCSRPTLLENGTTDIEDDGFFCDPDTSLTALCPDSSCQSQVEQLSVVSPRLQLSVSRMFFIRSVWFQLARQRSS